MDRAQSAFDDAGHARIAEAVRREEARCLGEVVPVVVDRSDAYPEAQDRAGIAALALATLVAALLRLSIGELVAAQAVAFVLGWFAGAWSPLARLMVGRRALDAMVRWRAEVAFREAGLSHLPQGPAVLLFASLFEHVVVVLGNAEAHQKLGAEAWDGAVKVLVTNLRAGRPVDGFVEAIGHIGDRLVVHVPRTGAEAGPNVMPDELRRL